MALVDPFILARAVLSAVVGAVAGVASGLFGIGGGVLVVPAVLLLVPGTTFFVAKAVSLFAMVPGSFVGVLRHQRHGNVDTRVGLGLGLGAALGAATSAYAVEAVAESTLRAAFGVLLVVTAARLYRKVPPRPRFHMGRRAHLLALVVGFAAGVLGGTFGVGGGILMVPALVLVGMPIHMAVGTSLVAVLIVGFSATLTHVYLGYWPVILTLGVPVAVGTIIGARFGADLAQKLPAERLRRVFAVFLAVVGVWMAARAWAFA